MVERLDLKTWLRRCCDEIIAQAVATGLDEVEENLDDLALMYAVLGENYAGLEGLVDA